ICRWPACLTLSPYTALFRSHRPPEPARFDAIWEMARYLFRHLEEWKHTCSYLQTVAARYLPHEVYMDSKELIYMKNGKKTYPDNIERAHVCTPVTHRTRMPP